MATTRYTVIEGEILSENRNGTKRDYVPDPLGSTLALLDNTQTQTDTFSYYPYGEVASRTGTTATPFQYIGTLGYYQDNSGRTYVRARHLRTAHGRWMTQDPIGFDGGDFNLYRYVGNMTVTVTDASGQVPRAKCPSNPKREQEINDAVVNLCSKLSILGDAAEGIIASSGCVTHDGSCSRQGRCLLNWCKVGCIKCGNYSSCNTIKRKHNIDGVCAYTPSAQARPGVQTTSACVHICPDFWERPGECSVPGCSSDMLGTILHEMMHACGSRQSGGYPKADPAENRARCLCKTLKL